MPTIEIVALNAVWTDGALPEFRTFDYRVSQPPRTHRWIFAQEFDRLRGFVVHLGNLGQTAGWFAGTLMEWLDEGESPLVFKPHVRAEIQSLLETLGELSPQKELVFSSDYQGGGKPLIRKGALTIADFLRLHDARELKYNVMYRLCAF